MSSVSCAAPWSAWAQQAPASLHATYETFAAGLHVADVETGLQTEPGTYQLSLAYHTTGMASWFVSGHQYETVNGVWQGARTMPTRYLAEGLWHGQQRVVELDYRHGQPLARQMNPSNSAEREDVPEFLQNNTIDSLSALAQLIRVVWQTGRCEVSVHTYDGRRLVAMEAHTVGVETLEPSGRSNFSGQALHCDFTGRLLAGFKFDDNKTRDAKPMHGSAWLATLTPGGPPMPVRMSFETHWFGDATMYLTGIGQGADLKLARRN